MNAQKEITGTTADLLLEDLCTLKRRRLILCMVYFCDNGIRFLQGLVQLTQRYMVLYSTKK